MWTIYLHELQDQLRSLRFQVSLVVLLAFFVANGVIYAMKMAREVEESARITADVEDRLTGAETIGAAASNWFRAVGEPTGTEFITEAGFHWFTDSMWMNPRSGWGMIGAFKSRTTNNAIRRFEIVDWTVVVRLVVSFLCVVLAYDAISGGLERGTLRLAMANPVSRGSVLIGRVLAQWTTLMVSVAVGVVVSLLILVVQDVLSLDARVARAILFFFLSTAFYVAFFLLLTTAVSALAGSSAASLVVMVLTWAVLTVVVPQTAYLVGSRVAAVEDQDDMWDRGWKLLEEHEQALAREGISLREPEDAKADNFSIERQYARHMADVEKEQRQLLLDEDQRQVRQYHVARTVNLLSPGYAYQYAVEAFLGAGLVRRQHFLEQARRYREALRQYIRGQDAADPDSPHVLFISRYMSEKPFNADDLPRFRQQSVPFAAGVAAGVVPIIVLCLEAALAFFVAFWAFLRLELAGRA